MAAARWFLLIWLFPTIVAGQPAALDALRPGDEFSATDSLNCDADGREDANACLAGLTWTPGKFTVQLEAAAPGCGEWLVRFPSPRPVGNLVNDRVAMEWFVSRDKDGSVSRAPAVVVVHESGRSMTVGRLIARGFSGQGLHAFLLHLPGYGARRGEGPSDIKEMLPALKQAIADVRRARDAVAALPAVDSAAIGVQGTSLGGFVTATAAGLDRGYDRVFILLAGGNLHDVVLRGAKDAAKTREKLAAAGVTDQQIKQIAHEIEPLRLAHRINARGTWLYSGKFDDVVPPGCSHAFAAAAKLPDGHHIVMPADHYSGILYLPQVLQEMHDRMMKPLQPAAAE